MQPTKFQVSVILIGPRCTGVDHLDTIGALQTTSDCRTVDEARMVCFRSSELSQGPSQEFADCCCGAAALTIPRQTSTAGPAHHI